MRRRVLLLGAAFVAGISIGTLGSHLAYPRQAEAFTLTELYKTTLEGPGNREAIMFRLEFGPGGRAGSHDHPVGELLYVIEGSAILDVDGTTRILKAGDSVALQANQVHSFKNDSQTQPVKMLVVVLNGRSQPGGVTVDQPVAQQVETGTALGGQSGAAPK
jgi:quercetin dioxygenase-like cupin family protein